MDDIIDLELENSLSYSKPKLKATRNLDETKMFRI